MKKYILFTLSVFCIILSCKKEKTDVVSEPVDTTDYSANRVGLRNWGNDTFTYTLQGDLIDSIITYRGKNNLSLFKHKNVEYCIWIDTTINYFNTKPSVTDESYEVGISSSITGRKLNDYSITYIPVDTFEKPHNGQTLTYTEGGYIVVDDVRDLIKIFDISKPNTVQYYHGLWVSRKGSKTISLK